MGRVFQTFGCIRSGQHAIINWLCSQIGNITHLNNCIRYEGDVYPKTGRFIVYRNSYKMDSGVIGLQTFLAERRLEAYDNENFLFSFENQPYTIDLPAAFDPYVKIVIVRDVYNWLSSVVHSALLENPSAVGVYVEQWKDHVAECLNEESGAVDVNYNKWFASEEYRKELCQRLKIPHSDAGLEEVGAFGGGSSFEGMSSHGQASRMDVFNRWKAIEGEPGLRRLFTDEIRELNYRYFEITYPFTSP